MIVVHIGLKKCGSASIQQFLSANDGELRRLSVDYPHVGREFRLSHANIAAELKADERFDASLGSLSDLVGHWRASPGTLKIISTEAFETLDALEIASLKRSLDGLGEDARIVMVIRDLTELLRSIYVQRIKMGSKNFSFDRFFEQRMENSRIDYHEMARPWAEVFGWESLRIRLLDAGSWVNGDLIDDFLAAAGVDPDDARLQSLVRPGAVNLTGDWRVLEAIRALNKGDVRLAPNHPLGMFMARAERRFDQRCVERVATAIGERRGWAGDKGRYLTRSQAQRCLEVYCESVAALNEGLSEPLPMPNRHDAPGVAERDFLPDASRIPSGDLMEFYDEMGECFARRAAMEAIARKRWRRAGLLAARPGDGGADLDEPLEPPVTGGKRLVVHIGLKKSGSASIQNFLSANEPILRGLSIDYTRVGRQTRKDDPAGAPLRLAHHNLADDMMGRKKFESKGGTVADLADYVGAAKHEIIIISSEMLEGCAPEHVTKFHDLLGRAGRRIQIVLVIRDLISLLPSSYAQKVRYGGKTYDFDAFYDERIAQTRVDYFKTASAWADVFGWKNISIRVLDRPYLANGDLIDDFLLTCGVDIGDSRLRTARRLGAVNETSGWKIIEATRALYGGRHGLADDHPLASFVASGPNLSNRKDIERAAIKVGDRFGWLGDKGLYLNRDHAQRALDWFSAAVAKLNERLPEPLPTPTDLEARRFVERRFLPSAEQIPAHELRAFYDDVAEARLQVVTRRKAIRKKATRHSQAEARREAAP